MKNLVPKRRVLPLHTLLKVNYLFLICLNCKSMQDHNLSSYVLALLGNAINQRMNLRSPDDPVGTNADATFNLLKNDWALHIMQRT